MTPGMTPATPLLITEDTKLSESNGLKEPLTKNQYLYPTKKREQFEHKKYEQKYKWGNIVLHVYMHLATVYGLYLTFFYAKIISFIFVLFYGVLGGLGMSAGSHRLFTHKSYKANVPLRIMLAMFHAIAYQKSIYKWVRDHRSHHKFSETDADPHNAKRGYFFAHMGWLLVTKHPDVIERGKTIDMTDVLSDRVVMFQTRYYTILGPLFGFIIPTLVPWYVFGEDFLTSWYLGGCMKFVFTSHLYWLINSAGHLDGMRPYDVNQGGTDNMTLKYSTLGENWHNYHHTFPWDYASSELGNTQFNLTTSFIDFMAKIGWCHSRKVVTLDVIRRRVLRTGDGSHKYNKEMEKEKHFWGWGDKEMDRDEKDYAETI